MPDDQKWQWFAFGASTVLGLAALLLIVATAGVVLVLALTNGSSESMTLDFFRDEVREEWRWIGAVIISIGLAITSMSIATVLVVALLTGRRRGVQMTTLDFFLDAARENNVTSLAIRGDCVEYCLRNDQRTYQAPVGGDGSVRALLQREAITLDAAAGADAPRQL